MKVNDEILSRNLLQIIHGTSTQEKIKLLEKSLFEILNYDHRNFNEVLITEVKIKTKNKPKYFKNIHVGQVFEILLEDVQKYAYGVIVQGDLTQTKDDDILIAYLDIFSDKPLEVSEISTHIERKNFIMIANSGIYSIINYNWIFVFTYKERIFSQEELDLIPYKTYFMEKYHKSIGDSNKEIASCIKIEEKEANFISNPLGVIGDSFIINKLCELYEKKVGNK
ncbi:hypothetical protein [Peribacillus loiseleuriae]|uniref:hypothetical protein n=1 Tax=Peribacillus loiseleuriae TaxID=1679170 RepID=UPI003CFC7479